MNFSLISVFEYNDTKVSGSWVQNVVGSDLENAIQRAIKTENGNSNQIDVAVVDEVPSPTPMLNCWYDRTRLDTRRVFANLTIESQDRDRSSLSTQVP